MKKYISKWRRSKDDVQEENNEKNNTEEQKSEYNKKFNNAKAIIDLRKMKTVRN